MARTTRVADDFDLLTAALPAESGMLAACGSDGVPSVHLSKSVRLTLSACLISCLPAWLCRLEAAECQERP